LDVIELQATPVNILFTFPIPECMIEGKDAAFVMQRSRAWSRSIGVMAGRKSRLHVVCGLALPAYLLLLGQTAAQSTSVAVHETLQPPAPAVAGPPPAEPVRQPPSAEPGRPRLGLVGAVAGESSGIAVLIDQTTRRIIRLRTGEDYAGWVLRSVSTREARLEKGRETIQLALQEKPGLDADGGSSSPRTITPPPIGTIAPPAVSTGTRPTDGTIQLPPVDTFASPAVTIGARPTDGTIQPPPFATVAPPAVATGQKPTDGTIQLPPVDTVAPPAVSIGAPSTDGTITPPPIGIIAPPAVTATGGPVAEPPVEAAAAAMTTGAPSADGKVIPPAIVARAPSTDGLIPPDVFARAPSTEGTGIPPGVFAGQAVPPVAGAPSPDGTAGIIQRLLKPPGSPARPSP
jgi:hypothetical protein